MTTKNQNSVHDFMSLHIKDVHAIIDEVPAKTFNTHDFIKSFTQRFQVEYVQFLAKYPQVPFQMVHQQIGLFLSKNSTTLGITYVKDVPSEDIFGIRTEIALWGKSSTATVACDVKTTDKAASNGMLKTCAIAVALMLGSVVGFAEPAGDALLTKENVGINDANSIHKLSFNEAKKVMLKIQNAFFGAKLEELLTTTRIFYEVAVKFIKKFESPSKNPLVYADVWYMSKGTHEDIIYFPQLDFLDIRHYQVLSDFFVEVNKLLETDKTNSRDYYVSESEKMYLLNPMYALFVLYNVLNIELDCTKDEPHCEYVGGDAGPNGDGYMCSFGSYGCGFKTTKTNNSVKTK